MAQKPETRFKEKIRPRLQGISKSWWFKTQQVSLRGIPDFIGTIAGRFVALELKATAKDKASPLQMKILKDIQEAGGFARVVSPENFEVILDDLRLFSEGRVGMMSSTLE